AAGTAASGIATAPSGRAGAETRGAAASAVTWAVVGTAARAGAWDRERRSAARRGVSAIATADAAKATPASGDGAGTSAIRGAPAMVASPAGPASGAVPPAATVGAGTAAGVASSATIGAVAGAPGAPSGPASWRPAN